MGIFLVEVNMSGGVEGLLDSLGVVHSSLHEPCDRKEPFDSTVLDGRERVLQNVQKDSKGEEWADEIGERLTNTLCNPAL